MGEYDGRLLILVTTFGQRRQAEDVVAQLVQKNLAVCGEIGAGLTSYYRWEGKVECDDEVAVTLKIRDDRYEECLTYLRDLHPYQVPQLLSWPVTHVNDRYGRWAWEQQL